MKDDCINLEDEEVPIIVMEENASDEDSKERDESSQGYSSTDEKENTSQNVNKIKAETFIFRE